MKTKTTALTTAVLLAMGTTASAQAGVNGPIAADVDIDIAAGSLIDEGMKLEGNDIAVEQVIITAKKTTSPKKKTTWPKKTT